VFKHALIQEAAYQSLLRSTRQRYHQRIAQVLETRFPTLAETQPELLAQHYTEAGLKEQAIPYWQQAGRQAIQRSANLEAIGHLTRGLDILKTLPDISAWAQQELDLLTTLRPALLVTKGYAAPEVLQAYARARQLCGQVGETPQPFQVLRGELRAAVSLNRLWQRQGKCSEARELLAPIYGWFTEGFDTADLREAKALLDTLS
jgi:predicted ATPase